MSEDLTQIADDVKNVIEKQKQDAITALLKKLFYYPRNDNSGEYRTTIGYVATDSSGKNVLISKSSTKDFFSLRRNTALEKAIAELERGYEEYASSIPFLATIPLEEFKTLIRIRIKNQVITNESNMLSSETLDKSTITKLNDTIEWKAKNLNNAFVRYNNLRNTFVSAMKSIQQSAEEAEGNIDASTLNSVVKEFLSKNLVEYTDLDYVNINSN